MRNRPNSHSRFLPFFIWKAIYYGLSRDRLNLSVCFKIQLRLDIRQQNNILK